jgi:hypothetical protein
VTVCGLQSLSATAAVLGKTTDKIFSSSTKSPHIAASPPSRRACCDWSRPTAGSYEYIVFQDDVAESRYQYWEGEATTGKPAEVILLISEESVHTWNTPSSELESIEALTAAAFTAAEYTSSQWIILATVEAFG